MKPILSIVIPTYNRCNYLKECLKSITECSINSQNKIEVIICDNSSKDNTKIVIKNFIESNNYLNKIHFISAKKEIPALNLYSPPTYNKNGIIISTMNMTTNANLCTATGK